MHLRNDLGRLAAVYRAGQHLALLLDYDAALASCVTHRALASGPVSAPQLLAQFAALPRVGVGVLTNRSLKDRQSTVPLPKLCYMGTSGQDIEKKQFIVIHPRAHHYRPYLDDAFSTLNAVIAPFDGAWLQDKTLVLTVHYLATSRDDRSILQQCLNKALDRYEGLLTAINGSEATDVFPDFRWGKGDTVRQIIESQAMPAVPLYAGSHASDEEAFRITAAAGGVAIGVGPFAPKNTTHHVEDPETLASELAFFFTLLSDNTRARQLFHPAHRLLESCGDG